MLSFFRLGAQRTTFAGNNDAMAPQQRFAKDTFATTTHIVLPNDTNVLGNLMGGQLLNWMDIASAISANGIAAAWW